MIEEEGSTGIETKEYQQSNGMTEVIWVFVSSSLEDTRIDIKSFM